MNFNILGGRGFRKMNILGDGGGGVGVGWGYDETVDILRGPSQNWTIFGSYFLTLNILGLFLKVKIQNWNIFYFIYLFFFFFLGGGLLTFNYFWVMPDFLGGGWGVNSRCMLQVFVAK